MQGNNRMYCDVIFAYLVSASVRDIKIVGEFDIRKFEIQLRVHLSR